MSIDTVKKNLGNKANDNTPTADPREIIKIEIENATKKFVEVLPKDFDVERFKRIAFEAIKANLQLLGCPNDSIIDAIFKAAQLGLEIGTSLNHCFILPIRNSKLEHDMASFRMASQGWLELIYRTGEITSLTCMEVYEEELKNFEFEYGTHKILRHKPLLQGAKGKVVLFYVHANLKNGDDKFIVMTQQQIIDRLPKDQETGKTKINTFWENYPIQMGRKTVLIEFCKYFRKSIELGDALSIDETFDAPIEDNETKNTQQNSLGYGERSTVAEPVNKNTENKQTSKQENKLDNGFFD